MIAFMDGFADYINLAQKYSSVFNVWIQPSVGRFGGPAMNFTNTPYVDQSNVTFSIPPLTNVVVGFAFQWSGNDGALMEFVSNSKPFLGLWTDTGGHLSLWGLDGGGSKQMLELQASTYILTSLEWHYCEVKVIFNFGIPSAGILECRIDGGVVMSSSAVNTLAGSNGLIDSIRIGSGGNSSTNVLTLVCDVYAVSAIGDGAWSASTVEYIGNTIEDSNGNIEYVCATAEDYKTGLTAPTWPTGAGQTVQDNNVTWTMIGPAPLLTAVNSYLGPIEVLTLLPSGNTNLQQGTSVAAAWASAKAMAIGATIEDSNSNLQRVSAITSDAKTGGTAPTWQTTPGNTTTDNHVTWTCLGPFSSSAFDLLNEVPPDDDSSYRSLTAPSQTDLFTFPTVPVDDSVVGVCVWDRARTDGAGATSIRIASRSSGVSGDNGIDLYISPQYIDYFADMSADPNTGALWTLSDLNNALSSVTGGGFGTTRIE